MLVKYFAQQKGIYGTNFGYFNGISWSILSAKILLMFPNYSLFNLIKMFFVYFYNFPFNKIVISLDIDTTSFIINCPAKIFKPMDSNTNITYSVTQSNIDVIKIELRKGLKAIFENFSLLNLFSRCPIFINYDLYLEIILLSDNISQQKTSLGILISELKSIFF